MHPDAEAVLLRPALPLQRWRDELHPPQGDLRRWKPMEPVERSAPLGGLFFRPFLRRRFDVGEEEHSDEKMTWD